MRQWYIHQNNDEQGPFSSQELKSLAASGDVLPHTLIRPADGKQAVPAKSIRGLFTVPQTSPANQVQGASKAPGNIERKASSAVLCAEPKSTNADTNVRKPGILQHSTQMIQLQAELKKIQRRYLPNAKMQLARAALRSSVVPADWKQQAKKLAAAIDQLERKSGQVPEGTEAARPSGSQPQLKQVRSDCLELADAILANEEVRNEAAIVKEVALCRQLTERLEKLQSEARPILDKQAAEKTVSDLRDDLAIAKQAITRTARLQQIKRIHLPHAEVQLGAALMHEGWQSDETSEVIAKISAIDTQIQEQSESGDRHWQSTATGVKAKLIRASEGTKNAAKKQLLQREKTSLLQKFGGLAKRDATLRSRADDFAALDESPGWLSALISCNALESELALLAEQTSKSPSLRISPKSYLLAAASLAAILLLGVFAANWWRGKPTPSLAAISTESQTRVETSRAPTEDSPESSQQVLESSTNRHDVIPPSKRTESGSALDYRYIGFPKIGDGLIPGMGMSETSIENSGGTVSSSRFFVPRGRGAYTSAVIGDGIGKALGSLGEARSSFTAATEDGTKELNAARRAFWEQYPSVAPEIEQKYAETLFSKDVFYLMIRGNERIRGSDPVFGPRDVVDLVTYDLDAYDGGLAKGTSQIFNSMLEEAIPQSGTMNLRDALFMARILSDHLDRYQIFLIARNHYEFWKAGKESDFFPTPYSLAAYMAYVGMASKPSTMSTSADPMLHDEAMEWIKSIESIFGVEEVHGALKQLHSAQRSGSGALANPEELNLHPRCTHLGDALIYLLGETSPDNYILSLLFKHSRDPIAMRDQLVAKFGVDRLMEVAEKIHDAPRTKSKYRYVLADAARRELNLSKQIIDQAFLELLEGKAKPSASSGLVGVPNQLEGVELIGQNQQGIGAIATKRYVVLLRQSAPLSPSWSVELVVIDRAKSKLIHSIDVTPTVHPKPRNWERWSGRRGWPMYPNIQLAAISEDERYAVVNVPDQNAEKLVSLGAVRVVDLTSGSALPIINGPLPTERGATSGSEFGASVAFSDSLIAVSAPRFKGTGGVFIIKPSDGTVLQTIWVDPKRFGGYQFMFGESIALDNNRLIASVQYNYGNDRPTALIFNARTGDEQGSTDLEAIAGGPPIFSSHNEKLLVFRSDGLTLLNLANGRLAWKIDDQVIKDVNRLLLRETRAFAFSRSSFSVIDTENGTVLETAKLTAPVILDGGRYRRGDFVEVYADDPKVWKNNVAFLGNTRTTGHAVWIFDSSAYSASGQ